MDLEQLKATKWYHGTDAAKFLDWQIPPPPVPGEQLRVPHTGVFFTSDKAFAKAVGPNLCTVVLSQNARLLDATHPSADTDRLRKEVSKHAVAATCTHVEDLQSWVNAWQTGEVLRFATRNPAIIAAVLVKNAAHYKGCSRQKAMSIAEHNLTRGWIELIVTAAKNLGFDALFGHEIDRHCGMTPPPAIPWLAVLDKSAVSAPAWE